jgi:glycosyltransferase involved in cell wall biosynthesis
LQLQLPADRAIILTVRNLVPRMNLEALISAMPAVVAQRPDALLLIVGDGPLRERLEALITQRQMSAHVQLVGALKDDALPGYYQAADLFIMPSKALEGFGLATLEALACGTPAVGTPVGGTQELLKQLDVTLLCKDTQPEALAYTILKTLQRLDRIGEGEVLYRQARVFAERFSVPAMAQRVEQVYAEAARVRVLHVHTLPVISGSGLSTLEAMRGQRRAGLRVEFACAPPEELPDGKDEQASGLVELTLAEHIAIRPLRWLRRAIHPGYDLRALHELWQLCRRQRYTVVHTHNSKAGIVGRLAARLAGVPVIVHTVHGFAFHDAEAGWRRVLYRALERLAAHWCDRLIFISQPLWDWAVQERIGCVERFAKIYSGVDLSAYRTPLDTRALRASFGFGPEALVIGEVAKLWEGKGHALLLRAFAQMSPRWPQARLLIIGDGPLRQPLNTLVQELQLADRVVFAGFRTDVPALTHLLDVAVLPSLFEGLGRAILEAQAAGKPIIGSRVGGIPDLIEDGANGLLISPGSVEELAAALERLCADEALRRQLGRTAQQRLDDRFDSGRMAAQIIALYEAVLQQKLGRCLAAPLTLLAIAAAPVAGSAWPEARARPREEASSS